MLLFPRIVTEGEVLSLMVDEPRITSCISFDVRFISMLANISVVIEASQGFYVLTYTSQDVSSPTYCQEVALCAYKISKFSARLAKCVETSYLVRI